MNDTRYEKLLRRIKELEQENRRLSARSSEHLWMEDELKKAHDQLERRMAERAVELMKANEQLKKEIEERKKAEHELKRTKEYLENVIDNSVDAIGIVDNHGRFILWNRRAAEIYGYNFDELEGKSAFDLYADPEELNRMLTELRRDGVVREYEIPMKKRDGNIVPMDISLSLLTDDEGRTVGSVCVARDLSERKKAEMELKRARDELSLYSKDLERQVKERTEQITSILRYTPAVVSIKDREGSYTLVNSRFEEIFGVIDREIQGKTDFDIFPQEIADKFRATDLKVLTTNRPHQEEELICHEQGTHTYLSVKFPLYNEQGNSTGVCAISTDITELKQVQEQLRRLSASIIAGQEKERAALARELHDELGQVLTALRLDAVWLGQHLKKMHADVAERAIAMRDLIDKTIDEVKHMALRLRPGVLDDLGLIDALEWYTNDFEKRTEIACMFKHHNVPNVTDIVATAVYRITQEALTNVARHSCATQVEVTLRADEGLLTLAVVDNGRGFGNLELAESDCLGIAGMRERASLVGGNLEIQSKSNIGTQLCCTLPLDGGGGRK